MKKIFGISLVAVLAVSPLMARAADGDPVAGTPTSYAANAQPTGDAKAAVVAGSPLYQLVGSNAATDGNAASAGYVKGAYNAAIKAVNAVHEEVSTLESNSANKNLSNLTTTGKANVSAEGTVDLTKNDYTVGTVGAALVGIKDTADNAVQTVKVNNAALEEDANGNVNITIAEGTANGTIKVNGTDVAVHGVVTSLSGYATETGVEATVNAATGSVTLNQGSGLTVAGTPTGTISNTVTGGSVTIPIMDDWSNPNTPATAANQITASVTGAGVTSEFTGTGITGGEATGTISGIDVSVDDYHATASNS